MKEPLRKANFEYVPGTYAIKGSVVQGYIVAIELQGRDFIVMAKEPKDIEHIWKGLMRLGGCMDAEPLDVSAGVWGALCRADQLTRKK